MKKVIKFLKENWMIILAAIGVFFIIYMMGQG